MLTRCRYEAVFKLTSLALQLILALITFVTVPPAAAAPVCPAQPVVPLMQLPHFRTALATQSQGLIVALGSSSTQGVMAANIAHSYPAVLQSVLAGALPSTHIAVINRGIGGQDAAEELARLDADVIAVRPQLVVWQVGANGALRNANPVAFNRLVTAGVTRLKAAGIDVILMDNQRSPKILAASDHVALEAALASIARDSGVNLFSRGRLMDAWSNEGAQPAEFLATDGLHHNDLGYSCVARALAEQIAAAVNMPVAVSTAQ